MILSESKVLWIFFDEGLGIVVIQANPMIRLHLSVARHDGLEVLGVHSLFFLQEGSQRFLLDVATPLVGAANQGLAKELLRRVHVSDYGTAKNFVKKFFEVD
jgi:hypothetical protein